MGESLKLYYWLRGMMAVWRPLKLLRAFVGGRRAGIAVITAVAMIPLLLMAGAATDFGRLYIAKSRLHYALDQGLLAVGAHDQSATPEDLDLVFDRYFLANYPTGKLGTATHTPLNINGSNISATATATVPTLFLKITGIPALELLSVSVGSQVIRQTTGLELALVLDNTGSMLNGNRLADLRSAATDLLDILYQGQATQPNVSVAVVPFVTAVNIGTANAAFVRNPGTALEYPFNPADPADPAWDPQWRGCVLARRAGNDVLDSFVPGGTDNGEWDPYFWEAETFYTDGTGTTETSCLNRWWRPDVGDPGSGSRPTGLGDPQFVSIAGSFTAVGGAPPLPDPDPTTAVGSLAEGFTRGPNKACPTPITPLTNTRAIAQAGIDNMEGWNDSGTAVPVGAAWGWRVLSPGSPFTEGVAYGTPNINKVMVIITDGQNNIEPANFFNCTLQDSPRYTSHYTGYGYTSDLRLIDVATGAAIAEMNNRLGDVCTNIRDADIEIFTITFGAEAANPPISTLMQNCATSAAHYFHAPTGAALTTAFEAIGARLTNLRVAQ